MSAIQAEAFRLQTSDEFGAVIDTLEQHTERLTPRQARVLEVASTEHRRFHQIPADVYEAFGLESAQSLVAWRAARKEKDFSIFEPHLQKIIDYKRQFGELWGYEDKPYDAMLYDYDPELLTKDIDPVFDQLLDGTCRLLRGLNLEKVPPLRAVTADRAHQQAVSEYLLNEIGFDLQAGSFHNAEDGFTCYIHSKDIRIAANDYSDNPVNLLFTALHEGGHGIFDQNVDIDLDDTNLYRGINRVEPSLVRVDADELTYNLHIIVRYECEKAIFNEKVNAKALRKLWNEKYKEYLGVVPANDTEGVLQDIHWVAGEFGYFPSYTLGNVCAAQFADAFEKQYGSLDNYVGTTEGIATLRKWLNQNIHQYGKEKKTLALVKDVCGEGINPSSFLRYMEQKLNEIY